MIGSRATTTLTAVMDALLPPGPGEGKLARSSASDLGLPERIPELVSLLPDDRARRDLLVLLRLLGTAPGGWLLYRRWRAFPRLSGPEAEQALRRMAVSRLGLARQAFQALKRMTSFLLATAPPGGTSPMWAEIGYPGPDRPAEAATPLLHPQLITGDTEWRADVVVVGSGAGGGVAAAVLARAGLDVVVLEKGGYQDGPDFAHEEATAYRDLYLGNGFITTDDGGVALLAGSTVGGGTTVNWTTSFPTPPRLRQEWDRVSRLEGAFTGPAFQSAVDAVTRRLSTSTRFDAPSPSDRVMEQGLRQLGWHVATQPRNVTHCEWESCGYCGMGCRLGSKQSTMRTFLADAQEAGARLVAGATASRVRLEGGQPTAVAATVGEHRLVVRAKTVVVAAGALSTPVLLAGSGVELPALGRHLRLHPATVVWGHFRRPVDPWLGTLQTRHSDEFADLDGDGFGFKLETGPAHPALIGLLLGWESGRAFKELFAQYRHWSPIGVLLRDRGEGRVTSYRDGSPRWRYRLTPPDRSHLEVGVRRAAQVLAAAGADDVMASTAIPVRWAPNGSQSVEDWLAGVRAVGYLANQTAYLSFHQMGSARMGRDADDAVVDGHNRVHGTQGLYVMDASCFPTASGVNPMVTISAIAHRGATFLAERLT